MTARQENSNKQPLVKRFFTSPFLLLVVLLIAVDGFVIYFQSLDKQAQFQQNPRLLAIRKAIESGRKPDVIVLGDSLIYSALFFADANAGLVADKSQHFTYLEARYLRDLVKKELGKDVDIMNLSMPAANPTDAYLILSELAERKKLPKVVLYGCSPRAMVDNLVPNAGAIGGKLALNVEPAGAKASGVQGVVARAVRDISDVDCVASKIREYGQLGDSPEPAKLRDFYAGTVWNYFHERSKVRSQFENVFLGAIGRKADKNTIALADVAAPEPAKPKRNKKKPANRSAFQVNAESFQRDLSTYRVRYNPPNFKKLDYQSAQLERCAKLLGENGSRFFVVSMPLSAENKALISDELATAYKAKLSTLATINGVTILDLLSTDEFTKPNFLDSAHLNGDGATILDHKMVSSMDQSWF